MVVGLKHTSFSVLTLPLAALAFATLAIAKVTLGYSYSWLLLPWQL